MKIKTADLVTGLIIVVVIVAAVVVDWVRSGGLIVLRMIL